MESPEHARTAAALAVAAAIIVLGGIPIVIGIAEAQSASTRALPALHLLSNGWFVTGLFIEVAGVLVLRYALWLLLGPNVRVFIGRHLRKGVVVIATPVPATPVPAPTPAGAKIRFDRLRPTASLRSSSIPVRSGC
jgi:hypothetical protein